jgi:hypothetical protein
MKHETPQFYINKCEKAGLKVVYGKGDHVKVYGPADRGLMVIPSGHLSTGVECKVVKWLLKVGVPLSILVAAGVWVLTL